MPQSESAKPYPPSYYAATVDPALRSLNWPSLQGEVSTDVAIVGGGFTGLSAALHLAQAGRSVVLLEAERIGWGASGRNGGQLHTGQRRDQEWLETHYPDDAARLWQAGLEARQLVLDVINEHDIPANYLPGHIYAAHRPELVDDEASYPRFLEERYGYTWARALSRDEMAERLGTEIYFGGALDEGGGHLHPLNLALGLAHAGTKAGAHIFTGTRVLRTGERQGRHVLQTPKGSVNAETVLYAGNGYQSGLNQAAEARVLPIANYIATTRPFEPDEPLPIPNMESASDTRFVIYYWRVTPDRRLLFGGGETYTQSGPKDVAGFVRSHLAVAYPHLRDIKLDFAWGGTLGITASRMPFLRRLGPNTYAAMGYSGHGVGIANLAGKLIAKAIVGETDGLEVFERLKITPFPGGTLLRTPLMTLAMTWAALRDRLGF